MAKKSEVQKLADWWKGKSDLRQPPEHAARADSMRQGEIAERREEPEEQYNIRIPGSLKKRLKRLVVEEEQPMSIILEKMLELYLQHRAHRAERSEEI